MTSSRESTALETAALSHRGGRLMIFFAGLAAVVFLSTMNSLFTAQSLQESLSDGEFIIFQAMLGSSGSSLLAGQQEQEDNEPNLDHMHENDEPDELSAAAVHNTTGAAVVHNTSAAPASPFIMDDVVRLLLPSSQQAEEYIRLHPGQDFRFFVYDNLPENRTWQNISQCILHKFPKKISPPSDCDWGASICTETMSRTPVYSKRRYNRNGDVVLAKIFSEYQGPLRTWDPAQADVFVVPYPVAGDCECRFTHSSRCREYISTEELEAFLQTLEYLNATTLHRHLFTISNIRPNRHPFFTWEQTPLTTTLGPISHRCDEIGNNCGHVVVPYVNTNRQNQPSSITYKSLEEREYALTGIQSLRIGSNNSDRAWFLQEVDLMNGGSGNLTSRKRIRFNNENTTLGGLPMYVEVMAPGRRSFNAGSEPAVLDLYANSIFCPCLSGDLPPQKRFFDAILGGCIPVVFAHAQSDETSLDGSYDYPSYFLKPAMSIRKYLPWAKGPFFGMPDMGIDFEELVVSVDRATCGGDENNSEKGDRPMKCLFPTLEDLLLNHRDVLVEKQRKMAKLAQLFSFGMEENGLQYADAVAALLVQLRHFLIEHERANMPGLGAGSAVNVTSVGFSDRRH